MASDVNSLLQQSTDSLFPGMTSDSNFSFDGTLGLMNEINLSAGHDESNPPHSISVGCDGLTIKIETLPDFDLNSPSLSECSSPLGPPDPLETPANECLSSVNVPFFGFPFSDPVLRNSTTQKAEPKGVLDEYSPQLTDTNTSENTQIVISFPSIDDLANNGKRKEHFQCSFCLASFDSNHKLCWHQTFCDKNPFLSSPNPATDTNVLETENPFKCSTCTKAFKSNVDLLSHICSSKRYTCEICGKSYSNICVKSRHMHSHSNVRPHKCNVCHKTFIRKEYLTSHLRIHTGDRPYSCQVCGKKFAYSSAKRSHMKLHKTKPFICSVCNRNFISTDKLQSIPVPGTSELLYSCEKCRKASETSILKSPTTEPQPNLTSELQSIEQNFTQFIEKQKNLVRNLKCDHCPRLYIRRSDLTKHMRTHTAETTPASSSTKTTQLPDLTVDTPPIATEEEVLPQPEYSSVVDSATQIADTNQFLCHLCNRNFAKKRLLLRHIYAHLGIKPYSCSICADKKYSRKEDLVLHMRTHTGERPFECSICDKKFIRRRSYRLHRLTHNTETTNRSPRLADNVGVLGEPEN